jgi:hypothetical protein
MKRAYSVDNVLNAEFNTLAFDGIWKEAIGEPELTGSWFVYGDIKNGKTSFTMMLTKYMTKFERVGYNSVEEGLSKSIKEAYKRNNMREVSGKFILINKESPAELKERLKKHRSPNIIVVDTVQFWELTFKDYKDLKETFPNKLFIYVSHVEGRNPDGIVAKKIHRDANVAIRIEGFKAFPVGRYGGGEPITISEEKAAAYWGLDNK